MFEELGASWAQIADVAATVPSPCSSGGAILEVTNLGTPETKHLWELPFGELLAEAVREKADCAIPVFTCNDANAAGQDDDFTRYGLKTDQRTSVFITTGTGMGGCLILDGSVFYGLGQAGELGHMKIAVPGAYTNRFSADPNPVCGCGGIQCVETRASPTGLTRRITWTLNESGATLIRGELAERGEEINPDVIAILQKLCQESPQRAAYEARTFADAEKDSFCRWLLEDWAIMIGALFASLAPAFHPDLFIIGGGMAEMSASARDWFLEAVQRAYGETDAQKCFNSGSGNCEIVWSASTDQGWCGAILLRIRWHSVRDVGRVYPARRDGDHFAYTAIGP